MDFIARLGSYKVVQALWTKCRSAGEKPAKLLGQSALRVVFPEVSTQLLNRLPAAAAEAKATESEPAAANDIFFSIISSSCLTH